jgi:hypothetical protein
MRCVLSAVYRPTGVRPGGGGRGVLGLGAGIQSIQGGRPGRYRYRRKRRRYL